MPYHVVVATAVGLFFGAVVLGIVIYTNRRQWMTETPQRSDNRNTASSRPHEINTTVNKITYNRNRPIPNSGTKSFLFEGKFENGIDVVVKKINIPEQERGQIETDLSNLEERLHRVVTINHTLSRGNSGSNIVKFFCHEFEVEQDRTYLLLALEACDRNLDQFIRSRHSFTQISNNTILEQLLCGLQFLHSRQIVHRDLKPSNVLIKTENNGTLLFKLSDFGLSKLNTQESNGPDSDRVFQSSEYGTLGWIPPEIYALSQMSVPNPERSYWKRSDIFALGLLFYYVASDGEYVFIDQDAIQTGRKDFFHVSGNIPLMQLLTDMLAPEPTDRPFTENIMKHPALWSITKQLEFFEKTSNLLTDTCLLASCDIENNAVNVLRGNCRVQLSREVENYLFPSSRHRRGNSSSGPRYDERSVQSLIRAIRNNKGHYYELSPTVRSEFGSFPDGYLTYWTNRFPELLMHTYNAMKVHRTEKSMEQFY